MKSMPLLQHLSEPSEQDEQEATFSDLEGWRCLLLFAFVAYFPEYALAPLFYHMGKLGLLRTALAVELAYMAGSSSFQMWVYRDHRHKGSVVPRPEKSKLLGGDVQTVLGVPVACLGMPRWLYQFASQIPNYAHVPQTAIVAGSAWSTYNDDMAAVWAQRWLPTPLVGETIAGFGLPGTLVAALAVSCVAHGVGALWYFCSPGATSQFPGDAFDCSNLLFLGQVFDGGFRAKEGVGYFRTFSVAATKLPMAWLKVSLLSLSWSAADTIGRLNLIAAVVLAFYAAAPAIPHWLHMATFFRDALSRRSSWSVWLCVQGLIAVLSLLSLILILVRFLGAFKCESHDLSILHGCTPQTVTAANATETFTFV